MKSNIIVVGDCSIDNFILLDRQDASLNMSSKSSRKICLNYGDKIPIDSYEKKFGGSALNVAVGLVHLGIDAEISSIIGGDQSGQEIISYLHDRAVNIDGVLVKGKTNQSFILLYKGERTILSHHLKRDYSSVKMAPKADFIYLGSAGEGCDGLISKITNLVADGAKLIFNPGSTELVSFNKFKSLLASTSVLIINKLEADLVLGISANIKHQLAKLLSFGTTVAIITDAKNGAYFGTSEGDFHMSAAASKSIDPTGAGDAFTSGLLGGLIKGRSLEEAARWGMFNSASVIEEIGATDNLLSIAQIDNLLKNNKILKFSRLR